MSITVSISARTEARLRAKAAAAGMDVETYAAQQLERMSSPPPSLKELSGPVAEAFAGSGMSDDELAAFLEAEKHAMRAERRVEKQGK